MVNTMKNNTYLKPRFDVQRHTLESKELVYLVYYKDDSNVYNLVTNTEFKTASDAKAFIATFLED